MSILLVFLSAYLFFAGMLYTLQRKIVFAPSTQNAKLSLQNLTGFEEIFLTAKDGTRLQLWVTPATQQAETIIYFHGNAGNISHRTHRFQILRDIGFGIIALSYRGYGLSKGSPTEKGIYEDARTAISYATQTLKIPTSSLILMGESLGTGVATKMAAELASQNTPVKQITLLAPYTSLVAIGQDKYPLIPVNLLMKDKFDSASRIASIHAPLMIFHGTADNVVPLHYGRKLFALAKQPKTMYELENITHSEIPDIEITEKLLKFLHSTMEPEKQGKT